MAIVMLGIFEFTNSEFIAFLASLNAIEYIIVLSLITILIMKNLNKQEREVIYNFFITIGQTMGSGVAQTVFQEELNSQKEDQRKVPRYKPTLIMLIQK